MAPRAGAKPKKTPEQPSGIGHNLSPDERETIFVRHMAKIRAHVAAIDKAKEVVKSLQKTYTVDRNACKLDGFPLAIVDEILEDEAKTRADLAAYEESRRFMRGSVGLFSGAQIDLFASLTPDARSEAEWGEMGYNAGIKGEPGTPPKDMPREFDQTWLKRWGAAQEKLAWALSDKGINPERSRTTAGTGPTADEIAAKPEEADADAGGATPDKNILSGEPVDDEGTFAEPAPEVVH